jgi:hypothetical protein
MDLINFNLYKQNLFIYLSINIIDVLFVKNFNFISGQTWFNNTNSLGFS